MICGRMTREYTAFNNCIMCRECFERAKPIIEDMKIKANAYCDVKASVILRGNYITLWFHDFNDFIITLKTFDERFKQAVMVYDDVENRIRVCVILPTATIELEPSAIAVKNYIKKKLDEKKEA